MPGKKIETFAFSIFDRSHTSIKQVDLQGGKKEPDEHEICNNSFPLSTALAVSVANWLPTYHKESGKAVIKTYT